MTDPDPQYVTHAQLDLRLGKIDDSIKALDAKISKPPNWLGIISTIVAVLGVSITATGLIAGLLWFVIMQELRPLKEDVSQVSTIVNNWSRSNYNTDDGIRDREESKARDAEIMRLLERSIDATDTRLDRIEAKVAGLEMIP